MTTNNPFVVGKYISDEYFCDRVQETVILIKHIKNGRNVALISPRRLGKTGLIEHLFHNPEIENNYQTFFVDIYSTGSVAELAYVLSREIISRLKPKNEWRKKFFSIVKSISVGLKVEPITGELVFDLSLGDIKTPLTTLDEIFEYLEQSTVPCLVAIDEFQKIAKYKEKNVEELLRTKIQRCKKTTFIFSGSERNLMSAMFNSSAKPFYQSAISMGLEPIPLDVYSEFVQRHFSLRNKKIQKKVISKVYDKFDGCTWFIQMIMNELFSLTENQGTCEEHMLEEAYANIIMSQEHSYLEILSLLAPIQKTVLQAIAKEGIAENLTSAEFIKKYNLRSASSVQSAVKGLLKTDILTKTAKGYKVYDYFFASWLKNKY